MLLILGVVGIMLLVSAIKIVPQQEAWIVERLGKFDSVLDLFSGSASVSYLWCSIC